MQDEIQELKSQKQEQNEPGFGGGLFAMVGQAIDGVLGMFKGKPKI